MNPDSTDRKIVNVLLKDGNVKYRKIAEQLRVTVGTVHNRIKNMEKNGAIKKFVPAVDTKQFGYDIVVLINMRMVGGHVRHVENKYAHHPNVCSVFDVTGEFDSAMIARFKNTAELDAFVKKLMADEWVERTSTNLILNVVKESSSPYPIV